MKKHIMEDKFSRILATDIVCMIVAYIGVSMRLLSRYSQHVGIKADDWWIVTSLVDQKLLGRVSGI